MADNKEKKPSSKAAVKRTNVASKATMNLAFHESSVNPKRLIPVILVIIIAALAFLKFGFLDQTAKKVAALNELGDKQTQLALVNAKLAGYDELANQYGRYSYGWMTDDESSMVDRMDVLAILEKIVDPAAVIENFAVNGNVVSANISGLSLDQTSSLVNKLEADPQVKSVSVYSAKSEEKDDVDLRAMVAMTIILEKEAE